MIELQQTGIRGCANAKSSDNLKGSPFCCCFCPLCCCCVIRLAANLFSLLTPNTERERERESRGGGELASSVNLISSCALISHTPQNSDNSHASTRLCITDLTYHCQ
jgi:hypothetical protein